MHHIHNANTNMHTHIKLFFLYSDLSGSFSHIFTYFARVIPIVWTLICTEIDF